MLASITCFPLDKGVSLSKYVAGSLRLIKKSGLKYKMGSMTTTVEGEPGAVFSLIKKIHVNMRRNSGRVYTAVVIDDRAGAKNRLEGKIDSVEKKLGFKVCR
jgi:uncharacterized protein (TIGR00106 family)